jgi:hypothetical protein
LVRNDVAVGLIAVRREERHPFSDEQIGLLQTFADQAVIAIENVRLFKELQNTNATLRDALGRQTATAEILNVISSTPTDVQPVFDVIVKSALRMLEGHSASVTRIEGDVEHLGAYTSTSPTGDERLRAMYPRPVSRSGGAGTRAIATGKRAKPPACAVIGAASWSRCCARAWSSERFASPARRQVHFRTTR